MNDLKRVLALSLSAVFAIPVGAKPAARTSYSIDPQLSKIEIQVAKDGFLKAFGHDHLVSAVKYSGEIQFDSRKVEDSSVEFNVETASLKVIDPGESEKDRNEVQATMLGEQVLGATRYPQIRFSSTNVKAGPSASQLAVEGGLTLHGVTKPMTIPVRFQVADDGTIAADAEVSLLQSDFGITPYKAAGGTVRVKDKLKLTFHIVAHKTVN
ncbi:MAG: YceI family protein [Acidobacteria bacterium]|nr:YceI family protein [Acidobacteriota bacterium]MBS1867554.1 YceI family protein [Acidobacteriota bacterium]